MKRKFYKPYVYPTQTDIVNSIGISAASVFWHIKRLIELRLIDEVKEGKYKRYQLHDREVSSKYITTLMRNYYPAIWERWSDRLIEIMFLVGLEGIALSILFFLFSGIFLQTELIEEEWYDSIESVIQAVIGIFSLLLLALSILAYRRTGLKKIVFAAIAFSLFAVQLILGSLEESFGVLEETPIIDILSSSMTLAILVLFFLAIVRKND
jgi:DNA-binding transcriptional ArsR family regulator